MKKILLAITLLFSVAAQAQRYAGDGTFNHLSLGVDFGTNGVGFELATPLCSFISLRAGMDFVPSFKVTNQIDYSRPAVLNNVPTSFLEERYVNIPENGAEVDVVGQPNMTQGKVLFDIYTGKRSTFHFTFGAYFGSDVFASMRVADKTIAAVELYNKDIADGTIKPEPGYPDGIQLTLEGYPMTLNKGRAEVDLCINKVRPYVGLGFGRAIPRKNVRFNVDLGAILWGTPKLVDKYGGNEISKDDPRISSDFSDVIKIINSVPVYPTIKFTLCGKIF